MVAFASGTNDALKGRARAQAIKEWKTNIDEATKSNRQAKNERLGDKLEAMKGGIEFMKLNVPGANHVQLLAAWDNLRQKCKVSNNMVEQMFPSMLSRCWQRMASVPPLCCWAWMSPTHVPWEPCVAKIRGSNVLLLWQL